MPAASNKKNTPKSPGDITINCKTCGKDPYDCKCKHPYVPTRMDKAAARILNSIKKHKSKMTEGQKNRVLVSLRKLKEEYTGNPGGETDISNADNLQVNEDEFTTKTSPEHNVVAKTFDTKADFDSYVNQRRGIQLTPKEKQSIVGYDKAKPTQQDNFFIKYEKTDDFGNNETTVIKKLKDGSQFCWTAFSKNETAEEEGKPNDDKTSMDEDAPPAPAQSNPTVPPPTEDDGEVTVNDPIRITKTITFSDDTQGSQILGDFLQKLNL